MEWAVCTDPQIAKDEYTGGESGALRPFCAGAFWKKRNRTSHTAKSCFRISVQLSSKRMGRNSPSVNSPFVNMIEKSSSQNSLITCRQAPQGQHGWLKLPSAPPTMAIALNFLQPSDTALNIAVLSAQIVSENELFSTLQPVNILPSSVRSAAPTEKPEYAQ